jgi:hypothetical protein
MIENLNENASIEERKLLSESLIVEIVQIKKLITVKERLDSESRPIDGLEKQINEKIKNLNIQIIDILPSFYVNNNGELKSK